MALGTITVAGDRSRPASAPLSGAVVSFPGDSSYPTGGTVGFKALVRAALDGREVDVLCVIPLGASGVYTAKYDATADTLFVEDEAGVEVAPTTSLVGTTFSMVVLYY